VTARTLILLRHGRTAWNASGQAQGHADIGLDEVGHGQAAAVAPWIAAHDPSALWTSDLTRAVQTASYVEAATGLAAKADPRLREYDVGDRQGLTMAEFEEQFPAEHAAWLRDDERIAVPSAETTAEVEARIVPALRECLESLEDGAVGVVVTHGAALRVGLLGLLGWPQRHAVQLIGMANCGWAQLVEEQPGLLRLAAYNLTAALGPGPPPNG
jgi:broad specificity phosphatase PhoE